MNILNESGYEYLKATTVLNWGSSLFNIKFKRDTGAHLKLQWWQAELMTVDIYIEHFKH